MPGDRLGELALPVAGDAGDPEHLARAHRRARRRGAPRSPRSPGRREAVDLEHHLADRARRPRGRRATSTSRPTISAASDCERRTGGVDGADRAAAAQHGDAVGDGRHLVQLVRDEDDRAPLGGHRAQRHEQRLGLLRRQHRGRLVEDQDARLAVERLEDLDPLLLADRELPDPRPRIDGDPVALAELGHALLDRARVEAERAAEVAVIAEHDVLGDGERLDEPEVLVHHPDAGVERVARRVELGRLAVELELALVGAVEAGEDVRERALAGAVLAEQSVNLADERLEVDLVVRDARPGSAS